MSFNGVNVNQENGLSGANALNEDNILCLIYALPDGVLPDDVERNKSYRLLQPSDAEDLGFIESFDANNSVFVLGTIKQYFEYAPEAVLHLIIVDIASPDTILSTEEVRAALRVADKVKGLGIAGTILTAIELADIVELVQVEVNKFKLEHRLIDFVLLQGNNGVIELDPEDEVLWVRSALVDLRTKVARNVFVSIGQDPLVAGLDPVYARQADIGSVLGMIAVRNVSENWGSVDIIKKPNAYKAEKDYPLTRANKWKSANLANGEHIQDLSMVELDDLTDKGYIYAGSFNGYPGVFLNGSPACIASTDDYANGERTRVWNKAARIIRNTLIPKVRGKVKKDPATGFIRKTTITSWERLVIKKVGQMENDDEISGFSITIPANQIPSQTTPVIVKASAVIDGIAFQFDVYLGLTNSI